MTDILGVIGGMGPLAGAYFCERVTQKTAAEKDSDHINMILYSFPNIPDRTEYLLDNSKPSPLADIVRIGKALVANGCTHIAVTCVTSHGLYDKFAPQIDGEIIRMPEETALYLKEKGIEKAGIMATAGTVKTGIFSSALEKWGIQAIVPDEEYQNKVMDIIYNQVKAGRPADMNMFESVCRHLTEKGSETVILGCTELSLLFRGSHPRYCVDAMDVLAEACIKKMGRKVRE